MALYKVDDATEYKVIFFNNYAGNTAATASSFIKVIIENGIQSTFKLHR